MTTFKDTAGRTWSIALNIAVAKRVRQSGLGVDLLAEDLLALLKRVFEDPILLVDLLFVIADANAEARGEARVQDVEFGRAMSGDVIEEGGIALLNALRDFTPSPHARAAIEWVKAGMPKQNERMGAAVTQAIALAQAELDGLSPSSSPESPASSPGATP